uniref:MAK10-like protein n=1 Tax=Tanacetum cinerariifolium TaxID=118510 RepID=A0A699H3Y3_TANCI|nr:MAK10-like protein [Tanacetum cinerariifolium]
MGDENPIRTLGYYSKPSHEGYRNTIELPVGNNVVPLQSDAIRLVQNECSFYRLRFEDPNQHLNDFLKLVDSLDLDGRTAKLCNDIPMFQKHHEESLSEAWTHFKDLIQKVPIMASIVGFKSKFFMTMSIPLQEEPLTRRLVAITLPQDVLSTSERHLIELENQVQCLMEAHLAPTQPIQVKKVTTLSGGKWYTFKPEQKNLGNTYNPSWRSHPNLRFEGDFKRKQGEITNKIDTVLKAITDQIADTLPSDAVKNPKLGISLVSFAHSYLKMDPQCSSCPYTSISAIKAHFKEATNSQTSLQLPEVEIKPQPEPTLEDEF